MMQMRTHTCNQLRLADVGKSVKIVGWMENVREVGSNLAFVVLRDFYGTTQVVAETEDMLAIIKGLNKESTISVEGVVRERASKNPKQATGEIEVVPLSLIHISEPPHLPLGAGGRNAAGLVPAVGPAAEGASLPAAR